MRRPRSTAERSAGRFAATQRSPSPSSALSEVSPVSAVKASPLAAPASRSPALRGRFSSEQRVSFLRVWARLPLHLRHVAFDLHGTDWTPGAIEQLGTVLCEFMGGLSKSKSDFGSCSLTSFIISVPEFGPGSKRSCRVQAEPHQSHPGQGSGGHLGPVSSGRSDRALDLSILEPAGGHPGEVRRRSDLRELQETQPDQQPQPAAHSSRESSPPRPGEEAGVFSLRFGLVVPTDYHEQGRRPPHTAFCTTTGLYECLVMPQGSGGLPCCFVKVIHEVIKRSGTGGGLPRAAYLDVVIVFGFDPTAHVKTIRVLFERLRKHNLKLPPSTVRLGTTDAFF